MEERPVLIRADYGKIELTLRELMEAHGISRNQLAKLVNVRFEVVNKWFDGRVEKMDLDVLARICYALNCRVEDVLAYRPGGDAPRTGAE